jgi:hypothetical protein
MHDLPYEAVAAMQTLFCFSYKTRRAVVGNPAMRPKSHASWTPQVVLIEEFSILDQGHGLKGKKSPQVPIGEEQGRKNIKAIDATVSDDCNVESTVNKALRKVPKVA